MKKIMLLISLLSLSLVACNENNTLDVESEITTTKTEVKESNSIEAGTKKGHGQNPEDYDGTGLELFGLSYNDNYINFVDCTAEDFVWFLQSMGISFDTSYLNNKLEPYGYSSARFDTESDIKVYNPYGSEIFVKDAKISDVRLQVSSQSEYLDKYKNIIVGDISLYNDMSSSSSLLNDYIDKNNLNVKVDSSTRYGEGSFSVLIYSSLSSGQEAEYYVSGEYLESERNQKINSLWKLPQIMK